MNSKILKPKIKQKDARTIARKVFKFFNLKGQSTVCEEVVQKSIEAEMQGGMSETSCVTAGSGGAGEFVFPADVTATSKEASFSICWLCGRWRWRV